MLNKTLSCILSKPSLVSKISLISKGGSSPNASALSQRSRRVSPEHGPNLERREREEERKEERQGSVDCRFRRRRENFPTEVIDHTENDRGRN